MTAADTKTRTNALMAVRAAMKKLEGVDERESHGAPSWFVSSKKAARSFAVFDDHHAAGRIALLVASSSPMQSLLVADDPDRFFVPPYVGRLGWVGVVLPGLPRAELERLVAAAHATVVTRSR